MEKASVQLLLIEDYEADALLVIRELKNGGFEPDVYRVENAGEMQAALTQRQWELVISDHNLPNFSSFEALKVLQETGLDIPFIVVSGAIGEETAVELMKSGASDYLKKDNLSRLAPAVQRELREAASRAERRKAQQDLEKARLELESYTRKLELSNRELSEFASVVSHDLQAPLRKVSIFTEQLVNAAGDNLPPDCQDYIQRIQNSVHRMQQLITDLLTLSRISRQEATLKNVDLSLVMGNVLDDLQVNIQEVNGQIEIGALHHVKGDATQIHQLLQNLLQNALKFHRENVPPVIRVFSVMEGPHCRITVQDNGIGFNEEYKNRIFEVFQRLHGAHQYSGTGIGLAIVRKIIERHNGQIQVESILGEGSTFTVCLPAASAGETDDASLATHSAG